MTPVQPDVRAPASASGLQMHYIGGEFRAGVAGGTFKTHNPTDGCEIAEVANGDSDDVALAVAAAKRAFEQGPWPRMSAQERATHLHAIASALREHAEDFINLEVLDVGMPIRQMLQHAERAARNFDYFAHRIVHLAGAAHEVGDRFLNYSRYKAVGVAGLITPWNAPLMLSSWKVAPCLAAGNTCVLKSAELTPLTSVRFAKLIDDLDLPEGVFNLVLGLGETAGAALVAHPDVRLLSFTGETSTGAAIMANGAPSLTRCSFELGGKSPVVVFDDCDFDRAVDGVVYQIFTMNGQRCTAGSRLLVQDTIRDRFVAAVTERARALRIGDPFDMETELGPLIGPEHRARVLGLIQSARNDGVTVLTGGEPLDDRPGAFIQPTVIADVEAGMRIFQEEVFGPVLVASGFHDESDAIALANSTRYGLAGYVWTRDGQRAHRVAHAIDSGMVWINSQNVRDLDMPFGGARDSGIGREGGEYGFEFFCESQTVHFAMGSHDIPRLGVSPGEGP